MIIYSDKIPLNFKNLPEALRFLRENGDELLKRIVLKLKDMDGQPANSNVTFKILAEEMAKMYHVYLSVKFYTSRNYFIGHNVISHATNGNTINFNTRFHSIASYQVIDWVANWCHELTHLADQRSAFSFDHRNQSDYSAAPMVVARLACQVFNEMQTERKTD